MCSCCHAREATQDYLGGGGGGGGSRSYQKQFDIKDHEETDKSLNMDVLKTNEGIRLLHFTGGD